MSMAVIWRMLRGLHGSTHQDRLEHFYDGQAADYDSFREGLLHGRDEAVSGLELQTGDCIADLGGGTGRNLESMGDILPSLQRIDLLDLCDPLLNLARSRCQQQGWTNVHCIQQDACADWPSRQYDAVLCSYSLSMIPNWFSAIDQAHARLRPGGRIAVVDFYVSRRFPEAGCQRHGALTRNFWPLWFAWDGVHLRQDLLPYLRQRFTQHSLHERRGSVPWMPGSVPYFIFIGERQADLPKAGTRS